MRVLHVSDVYLPRLGGIEVLVHDLAGKQAESGLSVTIVTRQRGDVLLGPDHAQVDGRVDVVRDARAAEELAADSDVVHAHLSVHSPLAWRTAITAARAGTPVVATVHSLWDGVWPLIAGAQAFAGVGRLPIHWAAVSARAAEPVARALNPPSGVRVLPNAIDVDAWREVIGAADSRHSADKSPPLGKSVHLVATQRMAHRKRPLALVDMLAELRRRTPESVRLQATLLGEGPLLESTRQRARRRGLDWVSMPGRVDHAHLQRTYASADIFVAPARLESFGIAALEARAAGLAVIGRTSTGLSEFVTDGLSGALASSDREMVEQLVRWCTHPDELGRIVAHNQLVPPVQNWAFGLDRCLAAYEAAAELQAGRGGDRVLVGDAA